MRKLLIVMVVGFSLPVLTAQIWASQRIALVIGNAAYEHAPGLANPLNDANDIGAALGRLGFKVTKLENADYDGMRRGLRAFTRASSTSEIALVFYAGHGIEVDKRNFLIPVDARLLSDREVEFETVSMDLVSRAVEGASGLGLVILDACRDNPFAAAMKRSGAKRSIGRGLARVEPSGETLVAYAAKGGSVAADGEGRNSPYSTALLAHVEEPGLEVGLMFRKVRDAVLKVTGGQQEPFVYGSLSSKGFYFSTAPVTVPGKSVSGGEVKGTAKSDEQLFWESVRGSRDPADVEAYLKQFPEGVFAALARNWLKRLSGPQVETKGAPEAMEVTLGLKRTERRRIQIALMASGFDPGGQDGLFGPRTRAAIGKWQASRGKAETGFLDAQAARELLEKGKTVLVHGKPAAMATLSKALSVAAKIREAKDRVSALVSIGEAHARVGEVREAKRIFTEALAAAEKVKDDWTRHSVISSMVRAQVDTGDFRGATVIAKKTKVEYQIYPLSYIAASQAKAGDIQGAEESISAALAVVERQKDRTSRNSSRRYLAKSQAEAGNFRGALAILKGVEGTKEWVDAISEIAEVQAEAGDIRGAAQAISDAVAMVGRIDGVGRVETLSLLANARVKVGDTHGAGELISKALTRSNEFERELNRIQKRYNELKARAEAHRQAGDVTASMRIELEFHQIFLETLGHTQYRLDVMLHHVAIAQAIADNPSAALVTAGRIENKYVIGSALAGIAEAQAKAGDFVGAKGTAQRIGKEDRRASASALAGIAEAQAKAGDFVGAKETAQRIGKEDRRASALAGIAEAQAKAGDFVGAKETAQRIGKEDRRASALAGIAVAQAKAGDFAGAAGTAQRIGKQDERAWALAKIAVAQAKVGMR